jgi:hypothetical protein
MITGKKLFGSPKGELERENSGPRGVHWGGADASTCCRGKSVSTSQDGEDETTPYER